MNRGDRAVYSNESECALYTAVSWREGLGEREYSTKGWFRQGLLTPLTFSNNNNNNNNVHLLCAHQCPEHSLDTY